ncbi:beta-N-acetylhexosaminidase [Saccharibacillus qingshengii]|uniref:beta-N-acetylhexosaminidase n=1 Tax=Saccharibacillus qingshengii TaxID=1763540 RepID=UPI001553B595|nr:beta-N-acetylhexosaminidase [Saccharibacillus qingshengii]
MARSNRRSSSSIKIGSAVLILLVLIAGTAWFLQGRQAPQTAPPSASAGGESAAAQGENEVLPDSEASAQQIETIVALAREGRIETAAFTVGRTSLDEVKKEWNAPGRTSQSGSAVYAEYPQHSAAVGYRGNKVIDLRSDDESLKSIRYRDILSELGEADSVKTYQDDTVDQIILGYDLPGGYVLRWVLPKPWAGEGTEIQENPALDHISVIRTASSAAAAAPADTSTAPADDAAPAVPSKPQTGGSSSKPAAGSPDKPAAGSAEAPDKPAADPAVPGSGSSAAKTLAGMTLEEKIGQMMIAGVEGTSLRAADRALIQDHGVGGVIFYADNIDSAAQTKKFAAEVQAANPEPALPLLVSVDQEGGRVARLKGVDKIPTAGAIGQRGDAAYARSIGERLGNQLLSQGFNLDYAPVLDVNSNPDNPVIGDRSFGADAALVSKLGIPVMQGLESKNVIPVVKHFPGHGDTSVDSHISLPVVNKTLAQLDKLELIPFKKAIAADADVVMIAHILLPKLDKQYPSSLSKAVITDLLRGKLGFKGVVMTDDMTMGAIAKNYGIGEAAVQSVKAGSDIVLVAHGADNAIDSITAIKQAVKSGAISEKRIDESVLRILALKAKYLK